MRPRKKNSLYPLWVGLAAIAMLVVAAGFFRHENAQEPGAGETQPPLTPQLPKENPQQEEFPEIDPPKLRWAVALHEPGDRFSGCLKEKNLDLVGHERGWLSNDRLTRISKNENSFSIETSLSMGAHRALFRQVEVAECFRMEKSELRDLDLDFVWDFDHWPRRPQSGGLPVESLILSEETEEALISKGLSRLGVSEIKFQKSDLLSSEDFRILFWKAVALSVLGGDLTSLGRTEGFEQKNLKLLVHFNESAGLYELQISSDSLSGKEQPFGSTVSPKRPKKRKDTHSSKDRANRSGGKAPSLPDYR